VDYGIVSTWSFFAFRPLLSSTEDRNTPSRSLQLITRLYNRPIMDHWSEQAFFSLNCNSKPVRSHFIEISSKVQCARNKEEVVVYPCRSRYLLLRYVGNRVFSVGMCILRRNRETLHNPLCLQWRSLISGDLQGLWTIFAVNWNSVCIWKLNSILC
jgi:hypothetical protein